MSIQFIKDTSGADAFVVVPIAEWKALQKRLAGQPIQSFGLTPAESVETRARLEAFAPDWDAPEMDAYDNYDEARTALGL